MIINSSAIIRKQKSHDEIINEFDKRIKALEISYICLIISSFILLCTSLVRLKFSIDEYIYKNNLAKIEEEYNVEIYCIEDHKPTLWGYTSMDGVKYEYVPIAGISRRVAEISIIYCNDMHNGVKNEQ